MNGWIGIKSVVVKAGATNVVLDTLQDLSIATASFHDGMTSKMVSQNGIGKWSTV